MDEMSDASWAVFRSAVDTMARQAGAAAPELERQKVELAELGATLRRRRAARRG